MRSRVDGLVRHECFVRTIIREIIIEREENRVKRRTRERWIYTLFTYETGYSKLCPLRGQMRWWVCVILVRDCSIAVGADIGWPTYPNLS